MVIPASEEPSPKHARIEWGDFGVGGSGGGLGGGA